MRSTVLAFLLLSARGGVAALAAWLVCRALRRAHAPSRFLCWLWLAVGLRFVLPWGIPLKLPRPESAPLAAAADTVQELADKQGLPKDTFTATVDRYNELAAKGEDEDYGKEDYRLSTLSEAPFYGVRQAGGYLICTIDGIQIDDNMHAIDQDFKAIPGLYVIGDMSGNYFSGSYPSLMAGAAAGRSATFGRLAGQNAAAGI